MLVGFKVLTAVVMNVAIIWGIAPCSPYVDRCSSETSVHIRTTFIIFTNIHSLYYSISHTWWELMNNLKRLFIVQSFLWAWLRLVYPQSLGPAATFLIICLSNHSCSWLYTLQSWCWFPLQTIFTLPVPGSSPHCALPFSQCNYSRRCSDHIFTW
jgi:hypothetical protein